MGYIYDDWKKLLESYQQCVEKELEEIHQQKVEIQQIKSDIFNRLDKGLYYHDSNRIVISAPEIVIGNVDKSGDLQGGIGRVVIKGSDVELDGVGETGRIISRAPSIRQLAVDPGIDGVESVVCDTSEIVSQAGSIVIHGSEGEGVFPQEAGAGGKGGVFIHADTQLQIESALESEGRKASIESQVKSLTEQASNLKKTTASQKKTIDEYFKKMSKLLEQVDKLNVDTDFSIRVNMGDVEELHAEMDALMPSLFKVTADFMSNVSQLAEVNRKKKALDTEKGNIKTGDDYKKNTTGASMTIHAESIDVATVDGDGNLHTNDEAGISVRTPRFSMSMADDSGKLVDNGGFSVNAQNISLSSFNPTDKDQPVTGQVNIRAKDINMEAIDYTQGKSGLQEKELTKDGRISMTAKTLELATTNPQGVERDEKGELTKGEYKAEGDVIVRSKTIAMETLDYELKDGKLSTKALTQGSTVTVRSEKMNLVAADAEGKATGSIAMNAKAVSLKSMDVDKEKLTDTGLAAGSTMTLVAEKMYVGQKTKNEKSKKLQLVSEELGGFADKTLEIQQGDGKALVQLSGGNASVGGSKTQIYGDTTINGKTDIKGDVKAPKATIDNIEAKSSFKSTNISDGIAVPGAPGGGSLSAKLKTEDAPKE